MIVWSVANQKGGVGKTTTAVTVAGLLAEKKKKVLLIDTDPHASLTSYLNYNADEVEHSVFDLFELPKINKESLIPLIVKTDLPHIYLLSAHMSLATLDRVMGDKQGMGLVLKKTLDCLSQDFDYALIDCPAILGVMMVNALAASDRVVIPVQTEFLALKGLERMLQTLNILHKNQDNEVKICIVPTMFDKRTRASVETLKTLRAEYNEHLWQSAIPIDTKFRDASLKHLPASQFAKGSRGVFAYKTLLSHLERLDK